jgi:hypothetical protein
MAREELYRLVNEFQARPPRGDTPIQVLRTGFDQFARSRFKLPEGVSYFRSSPTNFRKQGRRSRGWASTSNRKRPGDERSHRTAGVVIVSLGSQTECMFAGAFGIARSRSTITCASPR